MIVEKINNIFILLTFVMACFQVQPEIFSQNQAIKSSIYNNSADFKIEIISDYPENLNCDDIVIGNYEKPINQINKLELFTKHTFWCKLLANKNIGRNQVFTLSCPNTTEIKLMGYKSSDTASTLTYTPIPYSVRNGIYMFELPLNTSNILIRIKTSQFVYFEIEKEKKNIIFKSERNRNLYYGISLGILILLLLYHIIIFFIIRENFYPFYVSQIAFSTIFILLNWGIFFAEIPHFINQLTYILLIMGLILTFLSYIKNTFSNKKIYVLYIRIIPFIILICFIQITFPSFYTKAVLSISILLLFAAFIHTTIKHQKYRPASFKLFLSSWIVILIGQVILTIADFIKPQHFGILNHAFEFGVLFNNIIIALALGNKLNIYKNEKKLAEILEIEALREKTDLINEQNNILEELIIERNRELINKISFSEKQKQEIELQNEIINNRINEIEKINEELIQKNIEISNQNLELEKHHKILEETVEKRTKKLIKAKERAIIADKLKTSFLNNLTQEINIPMNAITGYSSIITDKDLNKETRNEYLQKILNYVDILLESVDNIVTLSRIQAGIIKPRISDINLIQLINQIHSVFNEKSNLSGKKIAIKIELPQIERDLCISADHEKIIQISNILSDIIIKHIEEGSITTKYSIKKQKNTEQKKKDKFRISILFSNSLVNSTLFNQFENSLFLNEKNLKYENPEELGLNIVKGLINILKGKVNMKKINNIFNIQFQFPINKSNN